MVKQKFSDIDSRLGQYKILGRAKQRSGFLGKLKKLYASALFFMLKPLLHSQNTFNQAVHEYTGEARQYAGEQERRQKKELQALKDDIQNLGCGLKKLQYKVLVNFPKGFDYAQFEDQFRGPEQVVKNRQAIYLDYLNKSLEVLDIGCGRGEFLELLQAHGFQAKGIDSSPQMVARCREKGLRVAQADALDYIQQLPGKVGNVFLSQIVEHMDYKDMYCLLQAAWEKMEMQAAVVIETINPGSFYAQSTAYVMDPSHVGLVSPETLSYTFRKLHFRKIRILYKSPVPKSERLQLCHDHFEDQKINDLVAKINDDLKKIDDIIFGNLEYAIIGVK